MRRLMSQERLNGVVVQLVRIPACHAGGRGFESRPYRRGESNIAIQKLCFLIAIFVYICLFSIFRLVDDGESLVRLIFRWLNFWTRLTESSICGICLVDFWLMMGCLDYAAVYIGFSVLSPLRCRECFFVGG